LIKDKRDMSNEYKKEEDLDDVIASLLDEVDEVEGVVVTAVLRVLRR